MNTITKINGAAAVARVLVDAAELVWNTYGVSSNIGRFAERALHRANEIALSLDDAPPPRTTPNQFSFEFHRHGQKLPGAMTPTQHRELGIALKRCDGLTGMHWIEESRAHGKSHRRVKLWQRLHKLVCEFKCRMDSIAANEPHPDSTMLTWYYGRAAE